MPFEIRTFGDPVLKTAAVPVSNVDGSLVRLAEEMVEVMYAAPGLGLAAPQVGIQKQLFVYDLDDGTGPHTLVNPTIVESSGEWVYDEGCLSIPGVYVEIVRPREVHLVAFDLDGNEISIEADEITARLFQHELDHLHGVLMFERMTPEQRKAAMAEWRRITSEPGEQAPKKRRIRLQ
jgi:peptide deformylase